MQALRHSKVKLTWDEDEPERTQVTRRTFTRKEIEENDFRAYIASSSSDESEPEGGAAAGKAKAKAKAKKPKDTERDRLRALLLGGGDDTVPEGWARGEDDDGGVDDVDMEITFTPGLSGDRGEEDETTLERYQRKMREKKKKRKGELRERATEGKEGKGARADKGGLDDDFFGADSDEEEVAPKGKKEKGKDKKGKRKGGEDDTVEEPARVESTAEELALLAASDNPNGDVKHFDMKAVLRAEKRPGKKKRGKKGKGGLDEGDNELQEDFSIDVKDERFKAVLEDHTFAIDPSNPQ